MQKSYKDDNMICRNRQYLLPLPRKSGTIFICRMPETGQLVLRQEYECGTNSHDTNRSGVSIIRNEYACGVYVGDAGGYQESAAEGYAELYGKLRDVEAKPEKG